MSKVLNNSVIPIIYDEKSKELAQEIVKILENNSLTFKDFFRQYTNIVLTGEEDPTSLNISSLEEFKEELANSLDSFKNTVVTQAFAEDPIQQETTLLNFLLACALGNTSITGAISDNEKNLNDCINAMYSLFVFNYYGDDKNKILDFIMEPNAEEKANILIWLKGRRRFELFNSLLKSQCQILIKYTDEEKSHDSFIKEYLIDFTKECISELAKGPIEEKNKQFKELSSSTLDELVIEFLTEIDPSLNWVELYRKLKEEKNIIYEDPNLTEKFYCEKTQNGVLIHAPLTGTIEDFGSIIHEFAHYVSFINEPDEEDIEPSIIEYPPILLEQQALDFLIKKGYSLEDVEILKDKREIWTKYNIMDVLSTLYYLLDFLNNGEITIEGERRKYQPIKETKLDPTDLPSDTIEGFKAFCNDPDQGIFNFIDYQIAFLIMHPTTVANEYPYIVGKYLATKTRNRLEEDPSLIYTVVSITNNLSNETFESISQKLNLDTTEFSSGNGSSSKPYTKQKEN